MNTEKLYIADPYNEEHVKLFKNFEDKNNIKIKTTSFLDEVKSEFTRDDYAEFCKKSNELHLTLFLRDETTIKDSCHVRAEKDRKACEIFFAKIKEKKKNRELLNIVSNYVFNVLGMEEIFVSIDEEEKSLKDSLEINGFENLGDVKGKMTFLKEKEELEEMSRVM